MIVDDNARTDPGVDKQVIITSVTVRQGFAHHVVTAFQVHVPSSPPARSVDTKGHNRPRSAGTPLPPRASAPATALVVKELEQALKWLREGKSIAVATVIDTWGSSPRPRGSQLVVADDGAFAGSVSGGCIEGAVITEALEVIDDGRCRCLEFGVSDEQAWEAGLACGGSVRVHVRAVPSDDCLEPLLQGKSVALVTCLEDNRWCLVFADRVEGDLALDVPALAEARILIGEDRSALLETDQGQAFVQVVNPPLRMLIVGAVHIAQTLVPVAGLLGFRVTVIDPRRAFATGDRLPEVEIRGGWPDGELQRLAPDTRTAVVVLTHDPKLDDPALEAALASPAYYIGALGSRRTHARRLERLRGRGFDDQQLQRIHSPVGLDIGAKTPAEIALAIVAEAIAAKYPEGATVKS